MPVLVIRIPARPRPAAPDGQAEAVLRLPAEFDYALAGPDGALAGHGRAAPALLPRTPQALAVLADEDVSWHRVTVPRAPAGRLRAALLGVLEEALLDDDDALHFALEPGAKPGQPAWVAVTHRPWLAAVLAELERHGLAVERVVAAAEPLSPGHGHFRSAADGSPPAAPWLVLARSDGVTCLRLAGDLARARALPELGALRWTAAPAAVADAERWLGRPVQVLGEPERLMAAAGSAWNLRQLDLAPRHRGWQAMRGLASGLGGRRWRAARWGLAALAGVQLVGLNAWAWQQRQAVAERRQAMVSLLQATHPQVRAVLDAPAQMARETERLRAAAGRPGDADLETLLAAAAAAWPAAQGPARSLGFEPGRLVLGVGPWSAAELEQFRQALRPAGLAADPEDGRIVLRRAGRGGGA